MKKLIALQCALILLMAMLSINNVAAASIAKGTLIKAVVLNMGKDGATVTDAQYDGYFKEHSAAIGVRAIVMAGQFYINGNPIPATAKDYFLQTPKGYLVNQEPWLYYDEKSAVWRGGYKGQTSATTYEAAALAVATGIVAGLEVRFYDTHHKGYTDMIDADFLEGVIVSQIIHNSDNTYSVYRGDIDRANKIANEGASFDGQHFTERSGEKIGADHFDASIRAGDVALFWYGPDGWQIKRAREVNGIFVDGADHQSYTLDSAVYGDAMRFSRDNLFISNRPGEFVNAQKYFGLNNNAQGLKVSLWLVPTTDPNAQGAPVGLTSNASASAFLAQAIHYCRERLASVKISPDGTDVPRNMKWVTQDVYNQLNAAITRANAVRMSPTSSASLMDYQIYLLYLTLNGSNNDIGAKFAGFSYAGFEHQTQTGKLATP